MEPDIPCGEAADGTSDLIGIGDQACEVLHQRHLGLQQQLLRVQDIERGSAADQRLALRAVERDLVGGDLRPACW